jgi:rod shape determining protein RodA
MSLASLEWGRTSGTGTKQRGFRGLVIDVPLLVLLLAIAGIGFVVLYSALAADAGLLARQGARFGLGLTAFLAFSQVPPRYLRMWTPWVFFLGVGLLIAVMIEGEIGKGAQRWLDLGFVRFQPSELLKLAAPMMVAWFMHERRLPPTFMQVVTMMLIVLVPTLLIIEQPDLGTAILVLAAGGLTILLAGVGFKIIMLAVGLGAAAVPVLWQFMHDYQRARVFTFLSPESDPLGTGYNTIQAKIAIGSGGTFGKGFLNGTQAHLEFLPERSTDFIFAVTCTSRSSAAGSTSPRPLKTRSRGCSPAR